jgi:hypothetical protein
MVSLSNHEALGSKHLLCPKTPWFDKLTMTVVGLAAPRSAAPMMHGEVFRLIPQS